MKIGETLLARVIGAERRVARLVMRSASLSFSQDYVSKNERVWMKHLGEFRGRPDVHLLEIGSYEGRSALWFLENILTHPSARITCVDALKNRMMELRFDHNIAVSRHSAKVAKIGARSEDMLGLVRPESCDIIYIDGGHQAAQVAIDASLSWPLLKRGGVLIFDDYLWSPELPESERPQPAIDDFLIEHESELELLHKAYQVIVRKPA